MNRTIVGLGVLAASVEALALDPTRSLAQFHHTSWTAADGMPANIWAITQTPDGYLWLGSGNGLYRFDGVNLERVAASVLTSPSIRALAATPSGGLWIGYERPVGVISLLRDGAVTNFPIDSPSSTSVHDIAVGANDDVWAATPDTILEFDGKEWNAIAADWGSSLGEAPGGVRSFGIAPDGAVWSKNLNGLFYLRPGASSFVQAPGYAGGQEGFTRTPDGRLWTADTAVHRLYAVPSLEAASEVPAPTFGSAVPEALQGPLLLDRDDTLWWASLTAGGLSRARALARPDSHDPLLDRFAASDGLSSDLVHTLFEDREGSIWVGTSLGLDRFRPVNVVTQTGIPVGFRARFVEATASALYAYTGWSGTADRATDGSETLYRILPHAAPEPLVRNIGRLRTMHVNEANAEIWLTTSKGVQRLEDGVLGPPIPLPTGVQGDLVYSAVQDKGGDLWISSFHHGVFRQDGAAWKPVPVRSSVAATAVLIADPGGGVWVRYSGGALFRVTGDEVADFSQRGPNIGDITLIKQLSHGLVVGGDYGIAKFDGSTFHSLRASADLPLDVVTGIAETDDGSTWIYTQSGIVRVATQDLAQALASGDAGALRHELIDSLDGLRGAPYGAVYGSSAAAGPDGRVWFTTGNGLVWIDPGNLYHNPLPPPVAIRSLVVDDRVHSSPVDLSLAAGTSNLEIDYTALSLSVPERVQFRYRLEGVDDDWVDAGDRRQAFYTRLGPGEYRFRVVAANNDGVWNYDGATLTFSIPPTFLQSKSFMALCLVAAALLLWFVGQARLARVAARIRSQLETRLAERERIARELHDTLLQGFQGLMLHFQSVADSIPDNEPARQLIEDALVRGDKVLAEGRDRVRDLRGTEASADLPGALHQAAQNLMQGASEAFQLVVEGTPRPLHPVVFDEVVRICGEALLNAFSHAKAKNIEVNVLYRRSGLQVRIRDDGVGIDTKVIEMGGRRGHFGLTGMRERAEKLKARFTLSSREGAGTEIEVDVPAAVAYAKRPAGRRQFWRHAWGAR